jgi:hypothetical protein
MKTFHAILLLLLLTVSRRFRDRWHEAVEQLAAANDEVEAGLRRIAVGKNGGRPRLRRVL